MTECEPLRMTGCEPLGMTECGLLRVTRVRAAPDDNRLKIKFYIEA